MGVVACGWGVTMAISFIVKGSDQREDLYKRLGWEYIAKGEVVL